MAPAERELLFVLINAMPTNFRAYGAEALGTALLVIGGCGAAIFAGQQIGVLGVALAFGLTLALIVYLLGPVSGAHVNPAVTLALALSGKFPWKETPMYMVAQVAGGIIGGSVLYGIGASIVIQGESVLGQIIASGFATNRLPETFDSILPGVLLEVIMSAVFVLAILATTRKGFPQASVPVTAGTALALVHLISIPIHRSWRLYPCLLDGSPSVRHRPARWCCDCVLALPIHRRRTKSGASPGGIGRSCRD
jgi:aquaporin Z